MKQILNFDQIKEKDKHLVGNKAFNLSLLAKQGINIAKFFVVTTSVFDKIMQGKKIKRLKNKLALLKLSDFEKDEEKTIEILKQISFKINQVYLSEGLQKELFGNFRKLDTDRVAIRSSATCEDQAGASFAGQFESFLSISEDKIFEMINKCWGALFTERVRSYCFYHQVDFSKIAMATIVQEMIFAEKGGVIFTEDVFQNEKNVLVIEAAKGLGEKVVSGMINPENIIVSKETGAIVEKHSSDGKVLNKKEIKELTKIALKIEEFYHFPQDIEWAIEKGRVYILQSRPITE